MAGVSLGTGLASGLDYASMVSQLMQIEARPQILLRRQLSGAQADAAAYRDINGSFAALAAAGKNLTSATTWAAAKATSSSSTVAASAAADARPASVTFSVDQLAAGHSVISDKAQKWATATTAFGLGSLTLTKSDNTTVTVTPVDSDGDGTISLADAVTAINDKGAGVLATAVNTGSGYQLQVGATTTGLASSFGLTSAAGTNTFTDLTTGVDAKITLGAGGPSPTTITSPTNAFDGVLADTNFTVSAKEAAVTVTVASDPDAVTNAVSAFVTAANTALSKIGTYTDSSTGSTAPLKGDYSLTSLANSVLTAVSSAVGSDGSAAAAGLQLTRSGSLTFDTAAFKTALASDPAKVQRLFSGATDAGADNVVGTRDDALVTDGLGARLQRLAQQANDSVNGTLTMLANGQDTRAKDLQTQIDAWDVRLAARETALTAQFNALETALGTLQTQASWLSSQLSSLPSWSSSPKS